MSNKYSDSTQNAGRCQKSQSQKSLRDHLYLQKEVAYGGLVEGYSANIRKHLCFGTSQILYVRCIHSWKLAQCTTTPAGEMVHILSLTFFKKGVSPENVTVEADKICRKPEEIAGSLNRMLLKNPRKEKN